MLDTDTVTNLLLLYLQNHKTGIRVNYTDWFSTSTRNVPFQVINFSYMKLTAEIHVYNPQFILVKRLDSYSKMCDNIGLARKEIDKLISNYSDL
jgi:hypothetical protein